MGSNLVEYLKSENEIYGLDIVSPEKDGVVKTFSWGDRDAGVVPAMDAIIHLAGKAHDTKNKSAADRVEGGLTEDVVPTPLGPYGESKIKAEEYVLGKELPAGKQVYIFRPCMIHGPGNKGNLNLLYSVVCKGIPWPLDAFENRRTFTSIENICFAVNSVLIKYVPSGIYNMGDDDALSTNELIEEICKSLGKKAHIWRLPKGLMTGIAKVGGWLHLPLNPDRLQKLTENYVSSNTKIKAALGVEKMPVDARAGLQRTLESFR